MRHIECKDNEEITMSLERYYAMESQLDLIDDIRRRLYENDFEITKQEAESMLNMFRKEIVLYQGNDANSVKIV